MGVETMVAIGLGASALGGIYGAHQQDQANTATRQQNQQNFDWVRQQGMGMMQQGPNSYAQQLAQFTQGAGPGGMTSVNGGGVGKQFTPPLPRPYGTGVSMSMQPGGGASMQPGVGMDGSPILGGGGVDTSGYGPGQGGASFDAGATGGTGGYASGYYGYNPSQVGGMDWSSLLGGGSLDYTRGTAGLLSQLKTGAPGFAYDQGVQQSLQGQMGGKSYDNTDLFSSLNQVDQQQQAQQLAKLQGSFGSLGQRFGTAAMNQQAQLQAQLQAQSNLQRQQIGSQSFESAQQRALQATGLGVQQEGMASQNALAGYQAQLGGYGALAGYGLGQQQIGLGQAGIQNQRDLANQSSNNAAGQFNAAAGNSNNQFYNNYMLQALGLGGNLQNQSNNYNLQLLGLMSGQQVTPQQPSAMPGAIGDIGQLLAFLPFLQQAYGKKTG